MVRIIIFDDGLGQFGPITDLRAAFEIRTGLMTTAGRIAAAFPKRLAGYWVPDRLRAVVSERANALVNQTPEEESILCISGRWAMPDPDLKLEMNEAAIEESTGHVVAALFRRADAEYFFKTGQLHERAHQKVIGKRLLYRFPWDILSVLDKTLPHDILSVRNFPTRLPNDDAVVIGSHPVIVHETAAVYPNVVFDAEHGPILVAERAVIRPGAVLCGPCAVGHDSTIIDRALIKARTSIGPVCKIAGEVGGTIFQGYANKGHDGHLGDSWVGKWVNFGAGTTNSNLLNTYGEVTMRVEPNGPRQRTGLTFLGAIVGDHAKFSICTRLMTGTVIGTGAMIASTAPAPLTTPRFAWITDDSSRTYRLDKFTETMKLVMARRNETPTQAYLDLLATVHARAQGG
jgi:UDP-N-acetylglucosamine diphosphorylase / glucose-1-phosphate thymidylyltransferase / UDP-N-acetylgalactosamine diphosphorylase / glucosamine-1-phosphate N-acetyltransferase / galactosamine-1-phosphate N-acetyltransferase